MSVFNDKQFSIKANSSWIFSIACTTCKKRTHLTIAMKCLIVFAVICAVALAQREGGLERFIGEEVRAIIHANPSITLADCTAKCDAVFALDVPRDEDVTDRDCARECRMQLEGDSRPTGARPTGA